MPPDPSLRYLAMQPLCNSHSLARASVALCRRARALMRRAASGLFHNPRARAFSTRHYAATLHYFALRARAAEIADTSVSYRS